MILENMIRKEVDGINDDLKVFEMDLSQTLINHQDIGIFKIQSENLTHIEQIIQNIEIKDSKKNNFTLNFKNEDLSNINEKTYYII